MTVVFPIFTADQELGLSLAKWFNELGGCRGHQVVFLYDHRCTPGTVDATGIQLAKAFDKVHPLVARASMNGWPDGPNYMFSLAATYLQTLKDCPYWLWMEPDATPLRPTWLDEIEAEHRRGKQPFTGGRVSGIYNGAPVPVHMTGIGVYPNPLYEFAGEAYRATGHAWDVAARDQIVPKANFTTLFCHGWRHPAFTTLDNLPREAVIFHGSKDGSLLRLLREKKAGSGERPSTGTDSGVRDSSPASVQPVDRHEPLPASPSACEAGDALFSATKSQRFGDIPADLGIHVLPDGYWGLRGDMITTILAQRGGLDKDDLLPKILPYIHPGDTVVDVGAFIGDHTVSYAKAVGEQGAVIAFEPNPAAFRCLKHNLERVPGNHAIYQMGIGLMGEGHMTLSADPAHQGGAYIGNDKPVADITVLSLDALALAPNLIKIDVEGYELNVLRGAEHTINKYWPLLVIEMNQEALGRQGKQMTDIINWLMAHYYTYQRLFEYSNQLYDIVALPSRERPVRANTTIHPPEQAGSSLSQPPSKVITLNDMHACVIALKAFAGIDTNHRQRVMATLRHAGLTSHKQYIPQKYRKSWAKKSSNLSSSPDSDSSSATTATATAKGSKTG